MPVTSPMVWIDLEMTGLDINKDVIIEIACIITDGELQVVEKGIDLIIHQNKSVMDSMNAWCVEHHGASGLTKAVLESNMTLQGAEDQVLSLVKRHVPKQRHAVLAGNSIHVDRQFLCKYMPRLVEHLHYRIVDVSTLKELASRWFPKQFDARPEKKLSHRALSDIEESIAELKYYRDSIFITTEQTNT